MASILIVEDDPLLCETLRQTLNHAGHAVAVAEDGRAALRAFDAVRPDLVLLDIIMPEMDGLETIRAVRQSVPDIPVIAMSGGGQIGNLDLLQVAAKFGANMALRKPFSGRQMLEAIGKALEAEPPGTPA
ncbi:MAG: response regulator [Alphaproteobacteria bacterium]|nr:response regulator [Alphaproteobacteria bacterium]